MGRKKIQISRITDERNRQVSFIESKHFLREMNIFYLRLLIKMVYALRV